MEMNKTEIARSLDVIFSPHPLNPILDRAERQLILHDGMSLRAVLAASDIDPKLNVFVTINGDPVRVADWDSRRPVAGDLIQVQSVVTGGGGGGSNVLKTVATIALMIAAPQFGPALGQALGISAVMGQALISIGGNLLLGAIFKPAVASPSGNTETAAASSPTYSLQGGNNRARPYEPLPVLLGRHIIYPDANSKPYTEYIGGDQYLFQVFNFGLTPGLKLSDYKIGDTPLSAFSDATLVWPDSTGQFPAGSGFYGNVDSTAGAVITAAGGAVSRTSSLDTIRIGIDIEAVLFYANDSGGMSERTAQLKIEYRPVGGVWTGFIPDAVAPITHYWAKGYWAPRVIKAGYYDSEGVYTPPVTEGASWIQTDFDRNLSPAAHVDGAATGEYHTGGQWVSMTDMASEPLIWRWVAVGNDPAPSAELDVGSGDTLTLRGSSSEQKRYSLYRKVTAGQYEVRITRLTPDETEARSRSDINWSALKSYQADEGNYPNQTIVGLKIRATEQLNGVVDQFSAIGQATTAVYAGSEWSLSGTQNAAWWYLHFARGVRDDDGRLLYGCGMQDSQIDIPAIVAWAAFCDANKLTFSGVLDASQTCYDTLEAIARCGFASVSWAPGKLSVVWDKVNAAVSGAFGMGNIMAGSFSVQYLTEDLAEEVIINYVDQETWKASSVRVLMPGLTEAPKRSSQITLWGCVSNAVAVKFGRSIVAGHIYRTRRITWEADTQGFVNTRGDVVRLSHDLTQWAYSGRVVAVAGSSITLDRPVPRAGGTEYLMLARPNGEIVDYVLTAASTESDVLQATIPIQLQDGYEAIDHIWFFSPLATPGKRVKILSVQPISQYRVRIVGTDDVPEYYAALDGVYVPPAVITLLPGPLTITALTLTNSQRVVDGVLVNEVRASWVPSASVVKCRVEFYVDGLPYAAWDDVRITGKTITVAKGIVRAVVIPFGANGAGPAQIATLNLSAIPAPAYPNVTLTPGLFSILVAWTFGDTRKDIAYTEIYASKTATTVDGATLLRREPYPGQRFTHLGLSIGETWRYWLRTVDTLMQPSAWHAVAGSAASPSASADSLLAQLQGKLGMPQLAAELASPIALIPGMATDVALIPGMAEDIIQRALDIDALTDRVLFERAVTDATIKVNPVTGDIELLATANITTNVESRLTQVETDLNAAEGSLTNTVATVAEIGADLETAQTQITQLAGEVVTKASTVYVDDAVDAAAGAITVEAANNAQALAEAAIRQALGLDQATDKELAARARIALAEQTLTTQANALGAEAAARLALAVLLGQTQAALTTESSTRATADAAEALARQQLAAQVASGDSTNAAAIVAEQQARANAISAEATARQQLATQLNAADSAIAASVQDEQAARVAADAAEAQARQQLAARVTDNETGLTAAQAAIVAEQQARANAINAEATARQQLATQLNAADSAIAASVQDEQTARVAADAAEAQARQQLAARVTDNETGLTAAQAAIVAEQQARANAISAEAAARQQLASQVDSGDSTNAAAIHAEAQTRATAVSAVASANNILQARLDTGDFAIVKQSAEASASALGQALARWGVKVQAMADGNIAVAGIELLSGADQESVFAILADRLLVYKPNGSGSPIPMLSLGVVNGQTALVLNGSLIADGAVVARHLSVDSLSAISANLGSVTAAQMDIYSGAGGGWGYMRSYAKWWGDGNNGWIMARHSNGDTGFEAKSGPGLIRIAHNDYRIEMPGISMTPSGVTISQLNVIDTLQIKGNAVTIPLSARVTDAFMASVPAANFAGAKVQLMAVIDQGFPGMLTNTGIKTVRVYFRRDGDLISQQTLSCAVVWSGDGEGGSLLAYLAGTLAYTDEWASGNHVYSVELDPNDVSGSYPKSITLTVSAFKR